MPTALEVAAEYRRQLDAANLAAIARLTRAYRLSLDRIMSLLDLLIFELGEGTVTRGRLFRLQRYVDLIEQIRVELAGLQALTGNEIATGGRLWVTRGEQAARDLISTTLSGELGLAGQFNRLPTDAVETLLGFLSPTGPLYDRLRQLAPTTFEAVIDRMVTGITLGQNPSVIARALTGAYGLGLTDAVRMVRTANVYAYRESNRAGMVANSDVVSGWYWWSQLIPGRTCMSCVAMHGTLHPLDESLNDHHNGLCVPLPAVEGFPNPVDGSGEDWFRAQSAATQRQMMGPGKFDAWTKGLVQIPDMTGQREDPVYGWLRVEVPLKELIPSE